MLFDADGQRLWLRQFGTQQSDDIKSLAFDPHSGTIAVGGITAGALPGQQSSGNSPWYPDAFVAMYDAEGRQLWLDQFGQVANSHVLIAARTACYVQRRFVRLRLAFGEHFINVGASGVLLLASARPGSTASPSTPRRGTSPLANHVTRAAPEGWTNVAARASV